MNTLSLMLYLTGLFVNVGHAVEAIVVLSALGAGSAAFAWAFSNAEGIDGVIPHAKRWLRRCIVTFCVALPVVIVWPNERTVHLILASELGETVVTNPEVIEVFDLLKATLMEQLKGGDE